MSYLIILAALVTAILGAPPAPISVICAGLVWALGYAASRHPALIRLGVAFGLFAAANSALATLQNGFGNAATSGIAQMTLDLVSSDGLLIVIACCVTLVSVKIGATFGKGAIPTHRQKAAKD